VPQSGVLRVGLTGGIACGKTTIRGFFDEFGAFTLDADRLAHEVIAPGGVAHAEVVACFGNANRVELARIVFSNPARRRELEAIVHPRVREEAARRIEAYAAQAALPLALFDAALLVETGAYRDFDRIVVARCSTQAQIDRLRKRDGFSERQAADRIAAQTPTEAKLAVADFVIDTEHDIERTRARTREVFEALLAEAQTRTPADS